MASSPLPRTPRSLADDLRTRTAGQITRLLSLRPDLVHPWPADVGQLARRAAEDPSVLEAMQSLTTQELRVLEVFACLHEATTEDVLRSLPADPGAGVRAAVGSLWTRALLWGGPQIHRIARAAQQAFGPYPCGLGPAGPSRADREQTRRLAADVDPAVLKRWLWSDPVSDVPHPLLAARGDRFLLPRETALTLRGGAFLPPAPPAPATAAADPAPGHSLWNPLAGVRYLLTDLAREPIAWHRARGVSRRTLSDRAAAMAVPEVELVAWLELASAAALVGSTEDTCRPTHDAERWLQTPPDQMWTALIEAWLVSERPLPACRPDQLGCLTTTGRPRTALHRAHALSVWPASALLDAAGLRAALGWYRPRMHEAADQADDFFAEAVLLGLVDGGSPTAALAGLPDGVLQASEVVPPATVGGLIVQPDQTVIAPLSVDQDTWTLLQQVARVESWGPVTTHRIDPARLRVAVAGHPPEDLLARLTARSRTPVPQSVEYAIRDAARTSPVRVYPATVVEAGPVDGAVLSDLGLSQVGPRAFTSEQDPEAVARLLQAAGIAAMAVAEQPPGVALDGPHSIPAPDLVAVGRLVAHLLGEDVRADLNPPPLRSADPETMVDVCRDAISNDRRLWLRYLDDDGPRTALVEPFELRSGRLSAWNLSAGRAVTVPLSRIAGFGGVDD